MIDAEQIKDELRSEFNELYKVHMEKSRQAFEAAINDKALISEAIENPYNGKTPKFVKKWKIRFQFTIGAILITILMVKGAIELAQTIHPIIATISPIISNILCINTYKYIANALGISAGIELGYMLFTDGPDETLEPLMMAIAAGAFYCVSESPENHSKAILFYALSMFVLILCLSIYRKVIEK